MIHVSAGIIRGEDGRILVCQRGEGRKNAHLWEFPGGKQEPGETAADCLARELLEELGLPVVQIQPVCERDEGGIHFTFLTCRAAGTPTATEHEDIRWAQPREMLALPFCPADTQVARALALNEPKLRHFFWDFDGTLVDTYPMMLHSLMTALETFDIHEDADKVLALQKNTLRYAIDKLTEKHRLPEGALYAAYCRAAEAADLTKVPAIKGIADVLARLAAEGGRHYIVTHRERATAVPMLESCSLLPYFTDMVTWDSGLPRKPDPTSCRWLLQKHGIDPAEAVMIGDRPLDTAAGRGAGMLSCLLDEEDRFPEDPCEVRVRCAAELPDALCPSLRA